MYFLYGFLYTLGFIILLPKFVFDSITKGKYAGGFRQRFGFLPDFDRKGKKVVWLHCVSVGETNAARPLAKRIKQLHPNLLLVVSTTTKTGQKVAQESLKGIADLVFYFPFDWRSTVRRALRHIRPSVVLLMETEIWFNFFREAYKSGSRVCIVNGRLSEKSFSRYGKIKKFMKRVLGYLELALMQDNADATRLMSLGIRGSKVRVTGNLKFEQEPVVELKNRVTTELRHRFGISSAAPLIIAASTHSPEEAWVLAAFRDVRSSTDGAAPRLMIAPRHPERFDQVAETIKKAGYSYVRRTQQPSDLDKRADVILLDTIGELQAAYPLAEVVFVGGSLIPHGGQSVLEPAAAGRPVITGPYTANFKAAVEQFRKRGALRQIESVDASDASQKLAAEFRDLLKNVDLRRRIAAEAVAVMGDNRGALDKTMEFLEPVLAQAEKR